MKQKKHWIALVTNGCSVAFCKAFKCKQKSKAAIVRYLQENMDFDGDNIQQACSWIGDNDLKLDLMVFEMDASDFNDAKQQRGLLIEPPPKEKDLYRVVYEIDIGACGPRQAAEIAWKQMMRAEDAFDPVLTVIDASGRQAKLDLSELLEFNKVTTGFVIQKYRKNNAGKFTCIDQEFIAGDDVQFENLKGDSIEAPEHKYQPFNMTILSKDEIIDRLGDVLTSIDVGGEQSRQFSHEIKILDELLRDLGWTRK